jgi:heptosyltransferase II
MSRKIQNVLLLIQCFIHFLFLGKANKQNRNPKNILIIPVGKLGDVVCTTPVFSAIRKHLPDTRIYIEDNNGMNKEILAHSGLSDGYLSLESLRDMKGGVKEYNIDTVVFTGPSFRELAYAYLSGVKTIITPNVVNGFCPQQTRSFRILSKFMITTEFKFGEYAPFERLKTLEPLGIVESDTKKLLAFSDKADIKAKELFNQYADKILVGITLSAGNKIKEWPVERFAEVANYVASRYNAVIVMIGGPNDIIYSEKMIECLGEDVQYVDTIGKLSIDELKAAVAKLNLFISVDTGPIYIAEAFNVSTIDILGPMDENEQPPRGRLNRVVKIDRKSAELHIMNARMYNKAEAKRQIQEITPKMVTDEVDLLMKELI